MIKYGYGLTDIVKRPSKSAAEITKEEFKEGKEHLKETLAHYKPQVAAYLGIGIYKILSGRKDTKLGLQQESVVPGIIDFVLPSPSGLNRMPLKDKLSYFQQLNEFIRQDTYNEIIDLLAATHPDARPELNFNNSFQCLIATLLSAQTTDKQVNKATEKLFARCTKPEDILELTLEELEEYIKGVGLYKTKAKNVLATCRILVEQYNSEVPGDFTALTALPGVGRKTANVVLSCAFDIPALAVDTHVFRVANRIGLATSENVVDTEEQLKKRINRVIWSMAHHWLIFHGRRICHARKPNCLDCPITGYCRYYQHEDPPKVTK
jgi:endonuclease III